MTTMTADLIRVDKKSGIPLFGVDFMGIIDRGTNIIEIKPITICNLKCKYCFVSAGDYKTNFIVDSSYLIEKLGELIEIKGRYDIEIHIAPYGESLLYPDIVELINDLWKIEGITIISMQSNGLLLNKLRIKALDDANLTRINISLNTLNEIKARSYCACETYDLRKLLNNIQLLLDTKINVLLAPVWFPGENDEDIEDVINYVKNLRKEGFNNKKIQIGIQKYLTYRTGRKLKKIRPKTWQYFYKQLSLLEKKYKLKLKLGPADFGIHKRRGLKTDLKKGEFINPTIISKGRWDRECIGKINENLGIKVLLKKPLVFSDFLIGKKIRVKIIKANYRDNIITAFYES